MVLFEGELSEKTHEFLVDSGGNFVMQYNLKYKLVNGILTVYQNEEDDFKFTFKNKIFAHLVLSSGTFCLVTKKNKIIKKF